MSKFYYLHKHFLAYFFSSPLGSKNANGVYGCTRTKGRELLHFLSISSDGMGISALQTLKQVSWLVEYTLWTYIFCDYNFQQFQFQQMILTLLHYLCSFSPQDVLAYIFQDLSSVCLDLKLLPWTSETYIVLAVFDISVFCFARCACKIHSVLHLCCSTLCNCSALCLGLLLYNILMRSEHVRYITASLVHS